MVVSSVCIPSRAVDGSVSALCAPTSSVKASSPEAFSVEASSPEAVSVEAPSPREASVGASGVGEVPSSVASTSEVIVSSGGLVFFLPIVLSISLFWRRRIRPASEALGPNRP